MRASATVAFLSLLSPASWAGGKLTFDDRVELTRGLMAEYATAKLLIPRSKKALEVDTSGKFDQAKWDAIAKESGPAARAGDLVQVTKVGIGDDRIVLDINGGPKGGGGHWYDHVQVGIGGGTAPISQNTDANAPGGTAIAILFHKPIEPIKAAEIKKMLAPVLDFDPHSATELYADTIPPEVKQAIIEKRALVGMNRDQVVLALGHPQHKSRETNADGIEIEDWVFGVPPGKIVFVTFTGDKVIKVKEAYAGLGSDVATPEPPR